MVNSDGMMSVKKDGSATIIATTSFGKSATLNITVPRVEASIIKINVPAGVQQQMLSMTISQGKTVQLSVTFYSNNFSDKVTTREVEWLSSDPSKVSIDENGVITAIQKTAGEYGDIGVQVTARVKGVSGVSDFIIVYVNRKTAHIGKVVLL